MKMIVSDWKYAMVFWDGQKEGWIASKQDTLERLQEMLSYHDKNPWESLREMKQGLKDEIKELGGEQNAV